MIRRVAGLALGALMLHLSVARADLACAAQDGAPTAAAPASSHHATGAGTDAEHSGGSGCETPAQADCCHAMVTCGVTHAEGDIQVAAAAPRLHDAVAAVLVRVPASRETAPEPPPPRA